MEGMTELNDENKDFQIVFQDFQSFKIGDVFSVFAFAVESNATQYERTHKSATGSISIPPSRK